MMTPPRMPDRNSIPFNLYKPTKPGTAFVRETERLTPDSCDEVRHIVIDLAGLDYRYLEGQSLGILPPGADERGKGHKIRLYSIASTRSGDDGGGMTASLCVKRAISLDPVTGAIYKGIASNYLCDLRPGDPVLVTGPAGKAFVLPEDPTANLILIATGTGIAPFRAFLRRIYREQGDWAGKVTLIFGARTRAELLYAEEFESYRDRPGYTFVSALSREQSTADGKRMYVQHRLAERIEEVWPLLDCENTYMYVCGLKGMEDGIDEVLGDFGGRTGRPWLPRRDELIDFGRILIETY